MRIKPIPREDLIGDLRHVHDEITKLIGRSQSEVRMINNDGALLGPFPVMLQFPQFGIPALSFMRALDEHATLDKRVREVTILTVAAFFSARFELYAHQIMARVVGLAPGIIAELAAGGHPAGLSKQENTAHIIARSLVTGHVLPESTYQYAIQVFGKEGVGELFFLVGGYSLLALVLNGFDMPAPDQTE